MTNYEKLNLPNSNGHEWVRIDDSGRFLHNKVTCLNCGYLRRVDDKGIQLNKPCIDKVKITLR